MADDLNAIVQKMMDAGESEENIGTVIQHYKQQAKSSPAPTPKWYEPGGDVLLDNARAIRDYVTQHPAQSGAMAGAALSVPLTGGGSLPLLPWMVPIAAAGLGGAGGAGVGLTANAAFGDAASPTTPAGVIGEMGKQGTTMAAWEGLNQAAKAGLSKISTEGITLGRVRLHPWDAASNWSPLRPLKSLNRLIEILPPEEPPPTVPGTGTGSPPGPPAPDVTWGSQPPRPAWGTGQPEPPPRTGGPTGTGTPEGPPAPDVTWGGRPVEPPFRPVPSHGPTATGTGSPAEPPPSASWGQQPEPRPWNVGPEGASSTTQGGETPQPSGMSAADRAAFLKRYPNTTPQTLARVEAAIGQPVASHAPAPAAAASVPIAEEGPLTGPSRDIGAEKVGRDVGMTTQEVRDARGSLHHEPTGEASPKLPTTSINRMVDTMREMPPGAESPERLAYVEKATSPKAHATVDTVRETLDRARQRLAEELPSDIMDKIKLGLIPPAALTARWAMLHGLNPVASHDQSSQ